MFLNEYELLKRTINRIFIAVVAELVLIALLFIAVLLA